MSDMIPTACAVCGLDSRFESESRSLAVCHGELVISKRGYRQFVALDTERAVACGQSHTLQLTERYLERGTFIAAHLQTDDPLEATQC